VNSELLATCLASVRRLWHCPLADPADAEPLLGRLEAEGEARLRKHLGDLLRERPVILPGLAGMVPDRLSDDQQDIRFDRIGDEADRMLRHPDLLNMTSDATRSLGEAFASLELECEDIAARLFEIAERKQRLETRTRSELRETGAGHMPHLLIVRPQGRWKTVLTGPLVTTSDELLSRLYADWVSRADPEFRESWKTVERLIAADFGPELADERPFLVYPPAGLLEIPIKGQSAGLALWFTLWLRLQNRSLHCPVAMTGRVTSDGLIEKVGDVREKVLVALQGEYSVVFIPEDNRQECLDLLKTNRVRPVSKLRDLEAWFHLSDPVARTGRELETIHAGNRARRYFNSIDADERDAWFRSILASGHWTTVWERSRELVIKRPRGGRAATWTLWLEFLRDCFLRLGKSLEPASEPRLWCEWFSAVLPDPVATAFLPLALAWFGDRSGVSLDPVYYRLANRVFAHDPDHRFAMHLGNPILDPRHEGLWASPQFRRRYPLLLWSHLSEPLLAIDLLLSLPKPHRDELKWMDLFLAELGNPQFSADSYAASTDEHRRRFGKTMRRLLRAVMTSEMPEWLPTFAERLSFDDRVALLWSIRYRLRKARHPRTAVVDRHLRAHCAAIQSDHTGETKKPLVALPVVRTLLKTSCPGKRRLAEILEGLSKAVADAGRKTLKPLEKAVKIVLTEAENRPMHSSGAGLGLNRIPAAIRRFEREREKETRRSALPKEVSDVTNGILHAALRGISPWKPGTGRPESGGNAPTDGNTAAEDWAFLGNPALEIAHGMLGCQRSKPFSSEAFKRSFERLGTWTLLRGGHPGAVLNHGVLCHWMGSVAGRMKRALPTDVAKTMSPAQALPFLAGCLRERPNARPADLFEIVEKALPRVTWRDALWLACFEPGRFPSWNVLIAELAERQSAHLESLRAGKVDYQAEHACTLAMIAWTGWDACLDARLREVVRREAGNFEQTFDSPETSRKMIQAVLPFLHLRGIGSGKTSQSFRRLVAALGREAGFPLLATAYFAAVRPWEKRRSETPFHPRIPDRLWTSAYERSLFVTIGLVEHALHGDADRLRRYLLTDVLDLPNSFFALDLLSNHPRHPKSNFPIPRRVASEHRRGGS